MVQPVLTTSRVVAIGLATVVALGTLACSSGVSSATTAPAGEKAPDIPASAFSNHTGVTRKTVDLATIATLSAGLFKGAPVGAEAYADYVNSTGGINGRKLVITSDDDKFNGAGNKDATQSAIDSDFATVGNFSLEDNYGGVLLKADPGMPDVSVVLDPVTNRLPNVFSPVPLNAGWEEGPIQYLKKKFPQDLHAAGAMVGAFPSAEADWAGQKHVLEQVGFKVVYAPTYTVSTTDFTQNVIGMKNAGVKILFLEGMSETYAASLLKDLVQQNYHPAVVLGSATYTDTVAKDAGGTAAINGDYLEMNTSLYLGQDASDLPAVGTFLHWVHVAAPGFQPDLYTLYAWLSTELFAQALKHAGADPSRGSELRALSKITSFDGNGLIGPTDPAAKTIGSCYLIARVVDGTFVRQDDPPVGGPTHGYRCDYRYINPPSS